MCDVWTWLQWCSIFDDRAMFETVMYVNEYKTIMVGSMMIHQEEEVDIIEEGGATKLINDGKFCNVCM